MNVWNGDYGKVPELISDDFRLHATLLGGAEDEAVRGPEGLRALVEQSRSLLSNMTFSTVVGPIVEGASLAGHWTVTGTYEGGYPGATAAPGAIVTFSGTDVLRIEEGKIAEYWMVADTPSLMAQLGVNTP
ncbi:hypothetical protein MHM582_0490 [Microbacterium sp. HM58-2]|nr:hypothetical protein MHM582_0490 [Microbacterium sp. HM58-2]